MEAAQARKRILVVEDNPDFVELVAGRLQAWGYEVLTAADGDVGLRVAREQVPDLLLLDILLPKMKGREVCAALKADPKTARIPIIFLTALGLADHIKAGIELGADDYIVKPFKSDELRERIRLCLLRHSGGPDAHREAQATEGAGMVLRTSPRYAS